MAKITIHKQDKALAAYYKEMRQLREQGITHEGGTRHAFSGLLRTLGKRRNLRLHEEYGRKAKDTGRSIRVDGALVDEFSRPFGYWEAKDSQDDLHVEIRKKLANGYPSNNIIIEDTREAVLFQDGMEAQRARFSQRGDIAQLLNQFLNHKADEFDSFNEAAQRYGEEIKRIATGLKGKIDNAHQHNPAFQRSFEAFMILCRESLNPNISEEAVNEMLIQHLMTERIITNVFDLANFTNINAVAREVQVVITALTSQHWSIAEFYGELDAFHRAVESAADPLDFQETQGFINSVYERFFQGYSVEAADTHGIVYTPHEIVDFMVCAVDHYMQREFGKRLGDDGIVIIDPATGTGNFVVQLLRHVSEHNRDKLEVFYADRLFANEVLLMPYYIASLNIEHTWSSLVDERQPFEGLCFVDTLDLSPRMSGEERTQQRDLFISERNARRIERQRAADINVIIGNPPYNVGQINENDNNKNRDYPVVNRRIRDTYVRDSKATLMNQLYDAYVKFWRWAVDRLQGGPGIVCYVSNNSFIDGHAFDGMRRHLQADFDTIYHLDLSGNARTSGERRRQEGGNVFHDQIRVGVGITVAIRGQERSGKQISYYRVPNYSKSQAKLEFLAHQADQYRMMDADDSIAWQRLKPNAKHTWLVSEHAIEFESFMPIGSKADKRLKPEDATTVFHQYSGGVKSNRDMVVYDYSSHKLAARMKQFIYDYNTQVIHYSIENQGRDKKEWTPVDDFVDYDLLKWDGTLKGDLRKGKSGRFEAGNIRCGLYRPYTAKHHYFDPLVNNSVYRQPYFFPNANAEAENRLIALSAVGVKKPFHALMTDSVADLHLTGDSQCFPFYTYDRDGSNRRENITDFALSAFRKQYGDRRISKWDIFYYVYALLHHPAYRERYAPDLRRSLPHIPIAPDFRAFARAGRQLAYLHLNYETADRYSLEWEQTASRVDFRVQKMMGRGKQPSQFGPFKWFDSLEYNDTLTLRGIPERVFAYRLGNRSALEWVVEQYRVKYDERSGITHDANDYSDDARYIVDLIARVITVSLKTMDVVDGLAELEFRSE